MIPVEKTALGLEQRLTSRNVDLSHEEIPEIEFPDPLGALPHSSDLFEMRFLILGDQNAGKTTFLHSLVDPDASHSTELLSYIPAISSSFVNARFLLREGDELNVMDEPPFLDSDIARTALLVTSENFNFMALESGVENPRIPDSARFVVLEFAEFGGDHLDRIASFDESTASPVETEIVTASKRIIMQATSLAYFVNCKSLNENYDVRMKQIEDRLQLVKHINPKINMLMVANRAENSDIPQEIRWDEICTHSSASGIYKTISILIKAG